jgi:hypothetical protein
MAKKSKRRSPPARTASPKALSRKNGSLSTILKQQGLFEGLKLCLDAGDRDSYPGSGAEWHDTSGNGYRFLLGSNAGGKAPEFHGNAGKLSSSEYWSFDGAGKFTYDGVNESWMQNLHKAGAKAWGAAWVWLGAAQIQGLFGTSAGVRTSIGLTWQFSTAADHGLMVSNAGSTVALFQYCGNSGLPAGQWHFVAFSLDEPTGTNGLTFVTDTMVATRNSAYSSPAAGNATYAGEVGSRGNNNLPLSAGSRLAMFCMGEGVAPSGKQLLALRDATRGRFGL